MKSLYAGNQRLMKANPRPATSTGSEQSNLFDILKHVESSSQRVSGLDRLSVIDWESFRSVLEEHLAYADQSKGGRIPWCPVLMLKVLVLQRFFAQFDEQLRSQGLIGKEGKIVDASFVEVPKQRNRRHENEQIKRGEVPARIARKRRRHCQKDLDARWTQKNGVSYFGYKNHVKVDAASKFVESFAVTHAAVHDSQAVGELLDERDSGAGLWADSAYVGPRIAGILAALGMLSFICEKGSANHPLDRQQKRDNKEKSRIRSRVEHAFGRIAQFGGDRFRRIGQRRCRFETALTNLTYNLDRYAMFHCRA